MPDYFQIVVPDAHPYRTVRLVHTERGTATVLCVGSGVRITFEMTFPTQEDMDCFLAAGHRSWYTRYGGRITALTPMHLVRTVTSEEGEEGSSTVLSVMKLARIFLVTPKEFRTARMLAASAIIDTYGHTERTRR